MAGDWIKMRTNLDTNPKVVSIAESLKTTELHVVGMLWKVWSWADQHSLDGNAISVTESFLDRVTSVTGFANSLRSVGWLDGKDGRLTFPNFSSHNGATAKKREETAERVAKHRQKVKQKCNADSVTDVTPVTVREEKRREENNKETHTPRNAVVYSEDFESWWSVYPRKEAKGGAWKAWPKAIASIRQLKDISAPEAVEWLVDVTERFADSPKGKGEFVPHPATFLNERRFDDDPSQWERTGKPVEPKKPPRICESEEQFREFQRLHGGD